MNPPPLQPGVAQEEPLPPVSTTFLIVTFVAAIAIGSIVAYLGINGMIGGPIP